MTGRFKSGKMSTGMRISARIEHNARPTTTTMIVIGRRIARLMSHILLTPNGPVSRVLFEETALYRREPFRGPAARARLRGGQQHRQSQLELAVFGPLPPR